MSSRGLRALRGVAAAGVATLVAAASHSLADGHTVSLQAGTLAFAFATLVCIALSGRRLSTWRVGLAVALSQAAFHLVFVTLTPGTAHTTGGHHLEHLTVTGVPAAHDHTSAAMWMAHAVACLITVALLRHGESGARTLVRVARRSLERLVVLALAALAQAVRPVRRARLVVAASATLPVAGLPAPRSLLFRGPPAVAL